MNRLFAFALVGIGLLSLAGGSAQAAGWHRTYFRPAYQPVVACTVPAPVVTVAPAVCQPAPCAPVVNYYPGFRPSYYNRFGCGPRVYRHRSCR